MKNRLLFSLLLLMPFLSVEAFANCPSPLPNQPSPTELRDCFNEIPELRKLVASLYRDVVPPNAVVAFDGPCPLPDWEPFEPATARVIIGAGQPTDPKHKVWYRYLPSGGVEPLALTPRELHESGGEENHHLSLAEMPAHAHKTLRAENTSGNGNFPSKEAMGQTGNVTADGKTDEAGGSKPHNTMPPYYALNFCKKSGAHQN
jgi:hypothetical protein